jgi:predicted HTH transcriptional regulator
MVFEYLSKYERISVKELSNLVNISERRASRTIVKMVRASLLLIHTKDNGEEFFTAAA